MATAEGLNAEANKLYMSGDKKGALELYSQAIGSNAKVAKYYSNRAQVLLDLDKFQRAANDAEKALELEGEGGSKAKHLFRAAQAYFGLKEYAQALTYGQAMLALDAGCKNGAAIVEAARKAINERDAVDPTSKQAIRRAGEDFLTAKDSEAGVYKLPSGLRFQLLARSETEATTARSPNASDECIVHYHGNLIDGTVFDSSVDRNDPASFAPDQVIPGWTEALQYMCEGEKWRVFLPYQLAYGAQGAGEDIPGYSTLIFTIEILRLASSSGGKKAAEGHANLSKALGKPYSELIVVQ